MLYFTLVYNLGEVIIPYPPGPPCQSLAGMVTHKGL
jgi:hypothetical protein